MALPDLINRLFSFTGFQQGQGDNTFPGTNIDADLDQTNNAVNGLRAGLATLLRPDGKLANGIVGRGSLSADILLGVGPSKPWSASQSYRANVDTVTRANKVYLAVFNSVGVDPLADTTSAYWVQTADLTQAVVVADGSIGTTAFADRAVTEPKLADRSVTDRVIALNVLQPGHAALNFGVVPVGAEVDYAGISTPPGWLLCVGQALPRNGYQALFAALTVTVPAQMTAGSTLVTYTGDVRGLGLRGAALEGVGVPSAASVGDIAAGQLIMSQPATASGPTTLRFFPYGRGDGATNFTIPDRRGRVTAGRDDMGGAAAGRLTLFSAVGLASSGGAQTNTLGLANLPTAMPGGVVQVQYPAYAYITKDTLTTVSAGAGGTAVDSIWRGLGSAQTATPDPVSWPFTISNPGGGNPFGVVQPTGIVNKIIFAGV